MPRRRLWLISPEGFRELRHSCLLSRKACAAFLGVCERTVRHWDSGRNRVPWSAVRLLRLLRCGDLGALHDGWAGWTLTTRGELVSANGYRFEPHRLAAWPLICEQARFWRDAYRLASDSERLEGAFLSRRRSAEAVPSTRETAHPVHHADPAAHAKPAFVRAAPVRGDGIGPGRLWRAVTAAHASAASGRGGRGAPGLVYKENKSPGNGENRMASRLARCWAS